MTEVNKLGEWLLVKRDLYWAPGGMGYTGIRDEAGRYSYEEAQTHLNDGVEAIHISKAPEFRKSAYKDLVIKHLQKPGMKVRSLVEWLHDSDAIVVNFQITKLEFAHKDYKGHRDDVLFRLQSKDQVHSFSEAVIEEAYIDELGVLVVEDTSGKTWLLKPVQFQQKYHPHADAWPQPEARGMKP